MPLFDRSLMSSRLASFNNIQVARLYLLKVNAWWVSEPGLSSWFNWLVSTIWFAQSILAGWFVQFAQFILAG